jgi:putative endonuclease
MNNEEAKIEIRGSAPSTYARGARAEDLVLRHLESKGFRILQRNFRWRGGEIDIVTIAPIGAIAFVEVRSARQKSLWLRHSIGRAKRERLKKTASRFFLANSRFRGWPWRFDVVWVEGSTVEHWPNVEISV